MRRPDSRLLASLPCGRLARSSGRHDHRMKTIQARSLLRLGCIAVLLTACAAPVLALAQTPDAPPGTDVPPQLKPEELDQLVAPIALYPDSLVAQVLMASTYPLEIVQAERWVRDPKHAKLTGDALDSALQQQSWDPSVKSLVSFPQVLTMLNEKLDWTEKLGDAFLAQQGDLMDAVQRLRLKAQAAGNLESTKEQTVVVEQAAATPTTTIIRIEPANPQVIYVPTYNPTVVYGPWPYPAYPPYYYYPPGYVAATSMLSFGVGMAVGASLWGGCNWGHGYGHGDIDIDVNRYNNFNTNVTKNYNQANVQNNLQNGKWQHDPAHRKGVNYRDASTREKYGKGTAKDAASRDQFRGRVDQGGGNLANHGGDAGLKDRPGAGGAGALKDRQAASGGARPKQGQTGNPASRDRGQASSKQRAPGAFEGVNHGSQARADSSRGHASRNTMASSGHGGGGARAAGARSGGGGGGRSGGGGGGRR